ncbi:MAG: hypothetical protein ACC645_16885 [Pirellulales bacterium]
MVAATAATMRIVAKALRRHFGLQFMVVLLSLSDVLESGSFALATATKKIVRIIVDAPTHVPEGVIESLCVWHRLGRMPQVPLAEGTALASSNVSTNVDSQLIDDTLERWIYGTLSTGSAR